MADKAEKTVTLTAADGTTVQFIDKIIGAGGMKDVYFSPDKSYAVAFYRKLEGKDKTLAKSRLEDIVGKYRESIFDQPGGEYWERLFCWPRRIVEWEGKLGFTMPVYPAQFFFKDGMFKGKEKEGKWFASAKLRNRFLTPEQKGTWLSSFHVCLQIARAIRRLHAAGLAHSDLSYKNILVDPETGSAIFANIIDCDGLVVPGKYPPDVIGTQDFIAPEVLQAKSLPMSDPAKKLPSILTDRHALAVLIYMYLLNRHPLRGGKVHDLDPGRDEELSMGEKALFIEHPTDRSNRPKLSALEPSELPQGDVDKLPYTICGPYLKELFDRAFIDGLHDPSKRPSAAEWEAALVKTTDLMQPCQNASGCEAHWFVFDNSRKPRCPWCGTEYHGQLPVLNLYFSPAKGKFVPESYRLMVYDKQTLYMWHVNRFVTPNEKISDADRAPAGDFHFHQGRWILINRRLPDMWDVTGPDKKQVKPGEYVELTEGRKILLSSEDGGRLVVVQLVSN